MIEPLPFTFTHDHEHRLDTEMKPRMNYGNAAPGLYESMDCLDQYLSATKYGERVALHFSEKEMSDLTLAIAAVNAWNRQSIAARLVPGGYEPAVAAASA